MRAQVSLLAFLLLLPAAAEARDKRFSLGVSGGSLGIGPELSWRPSELFGVRANAGFLGFNHDETANALTYQGRLKLNSFGLLADFYPMAGNFRVSGGARLNKNKVDVTTTPLSSVTLGAVVYTPAQIGTIAGTIKVNEVTPQVTIGYGGRIVSGLYAGIEAGALYQGKPKVANYTASGGLAADPAFNANLLLEKAALEDKVSKYEVFPVLQVNLGWRF